MAARSPLADLSAQDRKRFYDITLGFMFVAAAALVGRTVGDALFLETYTAGDLAYMYPATALVVSIVAYGYGRLASRLALARLTAMLALLLGVVCIALRSALTLPEDSIPRIAAYLVGDLVVNLPMILFWSFAAQCFVPGQAKRLFGLVGAGGTTACIIAGFVVRPFAAAFGTPNLLVLIAALLVGFAWVVTRTSRRDGIGRQPPQAAGGDGGIGSLSSLLSNAQIRAIVGLMLAATVALTLIDYQFKAGTRLNVPIDGLASFFGTFYGAASAVSLVIQLFLVHKILQKGGVFAGLAVLPIALILTSAVAFTTRAFEWNVATKFAVQIFAFTIDSAAIQMLYLGIARQTRSQARALAEGIGKPLATGLTGLCLILFADTSTLYQLALIAAVIAVGWAVLARVNHVAYIRSLAESLGRKQFDVSQETTAVHDVALESHIRESFADATDEEVVYLLGVLPSLEDVDWSEEYRGMLDRRDPRIKIAALAYLREHGEDGDVPALITHLEHADPSVREGAIDALASLGSAEHLALIEERLTDPAPETRAAAIAALINSEDLDPLLSAGAELRQMLTSDQVSDRIAAAHALGRLKRGGLVRPLIGLLQDQDTGVLRAALEACTRQQDQKLIAAIAPLLANPRVAALAGDTVAAFGTAALDHLIPYIELADVEGAFPGAAGIPPILARIGDPAALPGLENAARSPSPALRASAILAFSRILLETEKVKERKADLERMIRDELSAADRCRIRAAQVTDDDAHAVLRAALARESDHHMRNAFVLLDVLIPSVRMMTLLPNLSREGEARGNALEVLENVLGGDLRTAVLATVNPDPAPAADPQAVVVGILKEQTSDWVRIGALQAVGSLPSPPMDAVVESLRHRHPVVRETALGVLASFAPEAAEQEARNLMGDEAEIVRAVAAGILQTEAA